MYYSNNGNEISAEMIRSAFAEGRAVIVYSHGLNGETASSLSINGTQTDTRGECWSVWDEVWTSVPKNLGQALRAAWSAD